MGNYNRPVLTKCWEKYLLFLGCIKDRVSGSHHHWKCPDCTRTITFWGSKKEVPRFHITNCLRTIGRTNSAFNKWAAKNC